MGCQDLIGSIYDVHETIVIVEYLQLVNCPMWVPQTSNLCLTGGLYLVICIGGCAYHRHLFVV